MPRHIPSLLLAALLSLLLTGVAAPLAGGAPTSAPGVRTSTPAALAASPRPSQVDQAQPRASVRSLGPLVVQAADRREAALGQRTPQPTVAAAPASSAPPAPRPTPIALSNPAATRTVRRGPITGPSPEPTAEAAPTARPTRAPAPTPSPKATPAPTPVPTPKPAPSYEGSSRFWYPALGISARWSWYGCEHGGDPDGLGPGVYRWGCTPERNIYLMSHAWSTFRAVQRGYHSGAMKAGQPVWYADRQGNVSEWRVKWVKRVGLAQFNATAHEWASNDTGAPVITLQTCDGRNNQFRIVVRIVPAG